MCPWGLHALPETKKAVTDQAALYALDSVQRVPSVSVNLRETRLLRLHLFMLWPLMLLLGFYWDHISTKLLSSVFCTTAFWHGCRSHPQVPCFLFRFKMECPNCVKHMRALKPVLQDTLNRWLWLCSAPGSCMGTHSACRRLECRSRTGDGVPCRSLTYRNSLPGSFGGPRSLTIARDKLQAEKTCAWPSTSATRLVNQLTYSVYPYYRAPLSRI
jgi:hypothetical protein